MNESLLERLGQAATERDHEIIRERVMSGGYSAFYELLERLKAKIKTFRDEEAGEVKRLLRKARELFPHPVAFSPAWQTVWDELEQITDYKIGAFRTIPDRERDGEWQVLMDNPFSNGEVVCYPGLAFLDAAYLYGYFRQGLEKNEYIRLQKVVNRIVDYGGSS
jgi:hypothetical protein